ncbi:MAG: DUF3352 domain-containing protein [Solirubrobacterales bacterium]|nr:DUF3352 domain-containing protein [Solirubrobacterales bacterium]
MPSQFKRFTIPSVLATGLAAFALSACGGGSDDSSVSELAKYAPADTPVFVEGAVQPDSDVAANIDSITEKLVGANLGDLIKDGISTSGGSEIDFDADIKPWLGDNAAAFVDFDPSTLASDVVPDNSGITSFDPSEDEDKFGVIIQTSDTDAAQSFIDKQAEDEGGSKDGEYEGFSYKITSDGSAVGIVDDNVVAGSSEAEFKAAVDASKGDNLADAKAFSDVADHAADGALATVFTSNDPYLESVKEQGYDFSGLLSALGYQLEDTGSIASLVPESNEISVQGYSNAGSDLQSGDPSGVIKTFPADSIFATGSGDVGGNATKILDALNQEGIPGVLKPGDIDQMINESSGQIDIKGIVESLETVAFFVNGNSERTIGGALVATSSDIKPIESSLRGISSLISLAGDASVRPLPGGVAGFRVSTRELPGRPVVVGVKGDRMVIGIGMKASLTALTGQGPTLADSDAYKAADASISGEGLDMFADPANIAKLVVNAGAGDPDAQQIADVIKKFAYVAAGSGDEDKSFEFNLGLQE